MADNEENRHYFPERLMDQFIQENRENEGEFVDPNGFINADIDENELRNVLANYFVNH